MMTMTMVMVIVGGDMLMVTDCNMHEGADDALFLRGVAECIHAYCEASCLRVKSTTAASIAPRCQSERRRHSEGMLWEEGVGNG